MEDKSREILYQGSMINIHRISTFRKQSIKGEKQSSQLLFSHNIEKERCSINSKLFLRNLENQQNNQTITALRILFFVVNDDGQIFIINDLTRANLPVQLKGNMQFIFLCNPQKSSAY